MSIHDFHSKLASRQENSTLFEALRHLRSLEDVQSLLLEATAAGGWNPWTEEIASPPHAGTMA